MGTKTRILQFPIANSYGGITHYALNNWAYLDKNRFECDFATMNDTLSFEREVIETGANVFHLSDYASNNKALFIEEFDKILDNHYDVVHLHTGWWKDCVVEELCMSRDIRKVIVHAHNTRCDIQDDAMRKCSEDRHNDVKMTFTDKMATDFWACSIMAADWLFGPQIARNKIRIMPNAINTDGFIFNERIRERKRNELGIEKDTFVIGNVGRLCFQKNQELLINAYARAFGNDKRYLLVLVGKGPLLNELKGVAQSRGIDNRVLFLGYRADVDSLYQVFDLFALTSRFEGLPISAIEAQCSGLKCLLNKTITKETEVTGNCVWVDDDVMAWTTEFMNSAKPYKRENMGEEIKRAGYDIKRQIKIVEDIYVC